MFYNIINFKKLFKHIKINFFNKKSDILPKRKKFKTDTP